MRISIIVPALNEARVLPQSLLRLAALASDAPPEIIVSDGLSSDATADLARSAGAQVVQGPPGRALQMNRGADAAGGELLLFLHADTELPPAALARVAEAVARGARWGRFDVRISGRPAMLRVVAFMMNLRSRLTGIATGDQAIFVTRSAFDQVGGFPRQPLMEDIEISRRLKRLGPPACLRDKVLTSGRRWESRGVWRTIFLMWRLRWAYWRGVSPDLLVRLYR